MFVEPFRSLKNRLQRGLTGEDFIFGFSRMFQLKDTERGHACQEDFSFHVLISLT